MNKQLCFYVEGLTHIQDTASNDGLSTIYKKTCADFRKEHPTCELVPLDYAIERINEALKDKYPMLQPIEETEESFYDAFECLPPMQYKNDNNGMSFKMSEMTCGDITRGYIKKNGKYYSMNVRLKTKHEEMCAVIN